MNVYLLVFLSVLVVALVYIGWHIIYSVTKAGCEELYNYSGKGFVYNVSLLNYGNSFISCEEVVE